MPVDVNKQIRMAVKTGKIDYGTKSAISNVQHSKAKLVILANNCPGSEREDILYHADLSETPIYVFQGSSLDLGALCEKPYPVSALSVREPGDSAVLELAENK